MNLALVYAATLVLFYCVLHLYKLQRVMKTGGDRARILLANTIGIIVLMSTLYAGKIIHISRMAILIILVA